MIEDRIDFEEKGFETCLVKSRESMSRSLVEFCFEGETETGKTN